MSRKKGNGYGDGTWLPAKIFLSPAWISLGQKGTAPRVSTCSPQVLCLLLGKRQFGKRKDRNNQAIIERTDGNRLTLTYKELEARGISQERATRSIDELLAKGFIEIIHPGGLYDKDKAIYGLSDDYQKWRVGDPPIRQRKRDVHRGYQDKTRRGSPKSKIARVSAGQGHTRQAGTPAEGTPVPTGDTQTEAVLEA